MKIAYFHGLETPPATSKNIFLRKHFDVFDPAINYKDPDCFEKVLEEAKTCDLLVGSSMGGWFAYCIGTLTKIPTLLFNPALHSRPIEPKVEIGNKTAFHTVILGKHDDVIDPRKTVEWLKKNCSSYAINWETNGHRTPQELFERYILKTTNKDKAKMKYIPTFKSFNARLIKEANLSSTRKFTMEVFLNWYDEAQHKKEEVVQWIKENNTDKFPLLYNTQVDGGQQLDDDTNESARKLFAALVENYWKKPVPMYLEDTGREAFVEIKYTRKKGKNFSRSSETIFLIECTDLSELVTLKEQEQISESATDAKEIEDKILSVFSSFSIYDLKVTDKKVQFNVRNGGGSFAEKNSLIKVGGKILTLKHASLSDTDYEIEYSIK